jgi:putative copper resistance protein D
MGGVPMVAAAAMLPSVAMTTYVGRSWAGGAAGLLLLLAGVSGGTGGAARLAVAGIGITVFVYARAAVSHAGDFGLTSVQLLVEGAHLWAISLWLGAVVVAAFVVLRKANPGYAIDRTSVAAWIEALSATATGALAVIVSTGIVNAWRGVGSVANLTGSAYGTTLLVKVGLVAIAIGLGGLNRFTAMPRYLTALRSPHAPVSPSQQRFVQVLRIEAVVLFAALVVAAVLSSSPLPPAT